MQDVSIPGLVAAEYKKIKVWTQKMASILSLQTGYFQGDMAAEYQEHKQVTAQNRREFRSDFVNTDLIKWPHVIARGRRHGRSL